MTIRFRASTSSAAIGNLPSFESAEVFDIQSGVDNPQETWYQIEYEDEEDGLIEGWVRSDIVEDLPSDACPALETEE